MNYWEYVQSESKEKSVLDESYNTPKTYVIKCVDGSNSLLNLLKYIKENGNGGHSFEIVVDPNSKQNKRSLFWDGDGPDRITEIVRVKTGKEEELLNIMRDIIGEVRLVALEAEFPDIPITDSETEAAMLKQKIKEISKLTRVITEGEKNPWQEKIEEIKKVLQKDESEEAKEMVESIRNLL